MRGLGRFRHIEVDKESAPAGAHSPAGPGQRSGKDSRKERTFEAADYLDRARLEEDSGNYHDALRLYSRALAQNPYHEAAWVGQLRCLVGNRDFREAQTWAGKALEYLPKSADVLSMLALALAGDGRPDEALPASDRAVQAGGNGPLVWIARAWVHGPERPEPAESCIAKALELGAGDPMWLVEAARFYMHVDRHAHALHHLQQACALRPAMARPWYLAGLCREHLGMKSEAVQAFREAVDRAPHNKRYRKALWDAQDRGWLTSLRRRLFGA